MDVFASVLLHPRFVVLQEFLILRRVSPGLLRASLQMGYAADPALSALNAYRKTKLQTHYQSTIAWINNWQRPEDLLSIRPSTSIFKVPRSSP